MHIYRPDEAKYIEPAGHFGGLKTTDVIGWNVGDKYAIQLGVVPPGGGGEKHKHDVEHQTFIILKGTYDFKSGDEEFTLSEGEAVLFEPGEYHEMINRSDADVHCLVVTVKP